MIIPLLVYVLPMLCLWWVAFDFDVDGDSVTRNRSLILSIIPGINLFLVVGVLIAAVWTLAVRKVRAKRKG